MILGHIVTYVQLKSLESLTFKLVEARDFASYDVNFLQVFQVRKVSGATSGKIFAMKVLKKVSESAFLRFGLWF